VVGESTPTLLTVRLLEGAYGLLEAGIRLDPADLSFLLRLLENGEDLSPQTLLAERIAVPSQKRFISPKSLGQRRYIQAIRQHDLVIGIGPAGTGKTYLAMAMAVAELERKEFSRIILARPAVEAGEKLGFLPGDLLEKVNPYLRPLYDALYDMLDFERAQRLIERGAIEVAPLAFMRGRTLNDSFIILDEAQNATVEQMKMFLTRLGFYSKAVITGDVTQVDLPSSKDSGLIQIQHILQGIQGIDFVYFSERDVVRHPLVQEIVKAYNRYEQRQESSAPASVLNPDSTDARSFHIRMTICIHNRQRAVAIHTMTVKKRALQIMAYLGCPAQELSVVFGNDRLLQELNRTYRHKDRPTNVLAFPQSQTYVGEPASTMLGDVIVSLPTAAREAHDLNQSLEERVVYLLLHGILHLLGYEHEGPAAQRRRMEALEQEVLAHLRA